MCDEPFNGRSQRRDDGVVCFVPFAEFSAWRCLTWGDNIASLVTFVADPATRFSDDLGDRCGDECFRVVGASGKGVGDVDGVSGQETDQLCVESGRVVLAAP